MVIREDFIMRQVEQFVKALAKILLNKKEQTESEFYDQLNSLTLHTVGLDLKSLKEMPVSDLFRLFSISGENRRHQMLYRCSYPAERMWNIRQGGG